MMMMVVHYMKLLVEVHYMQLVVVVHRMQLVAVEFHMQLVVVHGDHELEAQSYQGQGNHLEHNLPSLLAVQKPIQD